MRSFLEHQHPVLVFARMTEMGGVTRGAGPVWLAISYGEPRHCR